MKLIVPAIALFSSLAAAENCQKGLDYCAFTLMGKGDYHQEILTALKKSSPPINPAMVNYDYYLYRCGDSGKITKTENCPYGCNNGGSDKSDYC